MKFLRWQHTIGVLILILAVACASAPETISSGSSDTADFYYEEETAGDSAASYAPSEPGLVRAANQNSAGEAGLPVERLIIRSGNLSLVVADPQMRTEEIGRQVDAFGGWVVESNLFTSSSSLGTQRADILVRVPADRFTEAMDLFKADAVEVRSESTSGADVTEEFVDVSARLSSLEATRDQVLTFLDRAETVQDALDVNRELSRLNQEIESLTARRNFLSESAAFSSISIDLRADADSQPIEIGRWQPQGTVRDAVESLIAFLQLVVDFAIWFAIVWVPALLIIALVLWLLRRAGLGRLFGFRRNRNANAAEPGESDESDAS